ncbi:Asparagine synthase [Planctomycetes bacterium CA13]|uniref:Asparagine synthase n=1 Tax=Novipirellula herctigrandis TaxID=2527986 RepID=A0A5C5Z267_9BACT|nr:Asparagine synthase [Planctomycetes bacterium CA13]
MTNHQYIDRLVNLLDPEANQVFNMSVEDATEAVGSGDPQQIAQIEGQFALIHKKDKVVRMARSIARPMRFFLAKRSEGPCLVVAERIDEIKAFLESEGLDDQFHPSYTRMVPAHYLFELHLIGCPDPNPGYQRFLTPKQNSLPPDLDVIGTTYISKLAQQCDRWLDTIDPKEPIGVMFSGGIDSGSVFLVLYHLLLQRGESPSRLKAFTLAVDGDGADAEQSREFLKKLGLEIFLETIDVPVSAIDYRKAIAAVEDYKPLDIQSATMGYALCEAIRERYPDWKYLVDGDGGDENLKDYPIEDNPELTIRSVLNNLMLYQEGWGVDAVKHSKTYSGGQSRGHVRTYAPGHHFGFVGFSPYALPSVIEVAESIPFIELTDWQHDKLYALKGEIVGRGIKAVTEIDMPVFPKRRFQHGITSKQDFESLFPQSESEYRAEFTRLYG